MLYQPTADERFGGAPPLAFSPQDPHTLYMAAQHVLASTDRGADVAHDQPGPRRAAGRAAPPDAAAGGRRRRRAGARRIDPVARAVAGRPPA